MDTPVSGGSKGWAISAVVVGSVILLVTLVNLAQVMYLVATGKTFAQDTLRGVVSRLPGKDAVSDYDALLAEQIQRQKEIAPLQLAGLIPYTLALAATLAASILLLTGRVSRVWLARAALVACVVRIGWGYVHYRVSTVATGAVMQGFERGMNRAEDINRAKGRRNDDEALRRVGDVAGAVSQALTVVVVAGQAILIAGYWGIVAYVFSKARRPDSTPATASP